MWKVTFWALSTVALRYKTQQHWMKHIHENTTMFHNLLMMLVIKKIQCFVNVLRLMLCFAPQGHRTVVLQCAQCENDTSPKNLWNPYGGKTFHIFNIN